MYPSGNGATNGWPTGRGDPMVCGESDNGFNTYESDVDAAGLCAGDNELAHDGWAHAAAMCTGLGARLCTTDEIQADETRGTGCGHDNAWVWGVEACDAVETDCHLIACGSTANGCASEEPYCAPNAELHEVSCCSDTDVTPDDGVNDWVGTGSGGRALCTTGIFGFRRPDGTNGSCNHAATYTAAVAWCADNGGRLCTADEVNNDCTRGTGCSHDGDLQWTSSQQSGAGHMISVGGANQGRNNCDECAAGGSATGAGSNNCVCTARCMADDDITAAVRCCADVNPGCGPPAPPSAALEGACSSRMSCADLKAAYGGWPVEDRSGKVDQTGVTGVCGESDNGLTAVYTGENTNSCFGGSEVGADDGHVRTVASTPTTAGLTVPLSAVVWARASAPPSILPTR